MALRLNLVITTMLVAALLVFLAVSCSGTGEYKYEEARGKTAQFVENAGETAKEAKEGTESWTKWAKEKITEGLGMKTEDTKETDEKATELDDKSQDKILDATSGMYINGYRTFIYLLLKPRFISKIMRLRISFVYYDDWLPELAPEYCVNIKYMLLSRINW